MSRSFGELKAIIEQRRRRLESLPLLRALDASSDVDDLRTIVPHVYFYVFAFQDMLRLAHERVGDPQVRALAGQHRAEDAGHEQWFLFDAAELGCARDVGWVLGHEHRPTRDVCYSLMSEIFAATDDRQLLAFVLVLEAAGSVFFPRVVQLLARASFHAPLRYFARSHQDVEADHDIFGEESARTMDGISIERDAFSRAVGLIDRCFDHFTRFAQHLEAQRSVRREE